MTGDCESNSVYAGSPARKIMTMDEYLRKRESAQFEEDRKLARVYRERFGKTPPKNVFGEYFTLFCTAEEAVQNQVSHSQMMGSDGFADSKQYLQNHTPHV